jgi:hypothetical protein
MIIWKKVCEIKLENLKEIFQTPLFLSAHESRCFYICLEDDAHLPCVALERNKNHVCIDAQAFWSQ